MRVTVVGCGRWGSFLAWYADRLGHAATLYGREDSFHLRALRETRTNGLVTLPERVTLSVDLQAGADAYLISIGSQGLRAFLGEQRNALLGAPLVLCMKGLEIGTGKRLTEVVADVLGAEQPVAVWIGPGHVQEFVRGVPNCMVIDSADEALTALLVDAFSGELIRFYFGRDLIGNELGAAAKNVVGIAAGALDGLGLGTLKGALMSRGTREVARLIAAMGGNELSAYGLCHLGDYEATVFSPYSHNRRFGECAVTGEPYAELAEGYYTVKALLALEASTGVELPICRAVYQLLYERLDARTALDGLLRRSLKMEF
jgi:glycerol-3-phosphate dehydrogenase (NAD(P)+)